MNVAPRAPGRPPYFSPTQLRMLGDCEKSYAMKYIEKAAGIFEDSDEAEVGNLCHAALERAALDRMSGAERRAAPLAKKEIDVLLADAAASRRAEKALVDEARAILLKAMPSISFAHAEEAERRFDVEIAGERVSGRFDRVDLIGESRVRVVDYKSGHMIPMRDELEVDPQTVLYLHAAAQEWPFASVVEVEYHYLRFDVRIAIRRTAALNDFAEELVRSAAARLEGAITAEGFPARVSPRCGRCPFRRGCEDYQVAVHIQAIPSLLDGKAETGALIEERQQVSTLEKLAEARRREIDEILRPRLAEARGEILTASGWRAKMAQMRRRSFPDAAGLVRELATATGRPAGEVASAILEVHVGSLDRFVGKFDDGGEAGEKAKAVVESYNVPDATTFVKVDKMKGGF